MATINIPGRLHSVATGNNIAGANEIYDDDLGQKQSDVNAERKQDVDSLRDVNTSLSEDVSSLSAEVEQIKATKDKSQGLFITLSSLSEAHPNPSVGDWALVGTASPFAIYKCVEEGVWSATGGTYEEGEVNLADYATKESMLYSVCATGAASQAKTVAKDGYTLAVGNILYIKFSQACTTYSSTTLNINSTGAKPLFYNGALATIYNSWEAGEVLAVYYDGTQYQAYNIGREIYVFDISLYNNSTYSTLAEAIAAIPYSKRKIGMIIKYVNSTTGLYSSAIYSKDVTTSAIFANVANWQEVTKTPRSISGDIPTAEFFTRNVWPLRSAMHGNVVDCAVPGYIFSSSTGDLSISTSSKIICFPIKTGGKFYLSKNISSYPLFFFDNSWTYLGYTNITPTQVATGIYEYSHSYSSAVYVGTNANSTLTELQLFDADYVANVLSIEEKDSEISALISTLSGLQTTLDCVYKSMQESNYTMCLMADVMPKVYSWLTTSSYGIFDVVSSTASSVTLSSADASTITQDIPLSVLFSDGHTDIFAFKAAEGTTVELLETNDADLSTAVKVCPLWKVANTQHLTGYGYKALAYIVDNVIADYALIEKNMVEGSLNMGLSTIRASWQDPCVYDADGNVVNTPTVSGLSYGGYAQTGLSNTIGVIASTPHEQNMKGWLGQCYNVVNNASGYIEFALGNTATTGFLSIVAGRGSYTYTSGGTEYTVDGAVSVVVSDDNGQITTFSLPKRIERMDIPITSSSNIKVRFVLSGSVSHIQIYSISAYNLYVDSPSLDGSRIAVLGDSWTQYPPSTDESVIPNDSFNVDIVRPDGSTGDGYGYFSKELARLTGATVDNWGKSGSTSEDWGLVMIDTVLNYAAYDYIVIEFFTNDSNQGFTPQQLVANLKTMVMKAKKRGVTPIVVMPCCTAAIGQSTAHGQARNYMIGGIL